MLIVNFQQIIYGKPFISKQLQTLQWCEGLSYIRQTESNQILLLLLLCSHRTSIQETPT